MRIESYRLGDKEKLEKKKAREKNKSVFSGILIDKASEKTFEIDDSDNLSIEDIKIMGERLQELGEELSQNPSPDSFLEYKSYIKAFLNIIKNNSEIIETESKIPFRKHKLYKTVEMVDKNLSEIAEMIMKQEKDRLAYLKLVNNISGLVIDLVM